MNHAMPALGTRAKFTSKCGQCGASSRQNWDRENLNRLLRDDKLEFLCQTCGLTWTPEPKEQAKLITQVLGYK
jgi:hypothetical protein